MALLHGIFIFNPHWRSISQGPHAAKNKNFAKSCTGQEKKTPKLKQIHFSDLLFMVQYNPADLEAYGCNTTEATELRLGTVTSRREPTASQPQSLIEISLRVI